MEIIIILILFIILIFLYYYKKEHYDTKLNNITFTTCANTCSRIYGCNGFAYNEKDNTCYFSHLLINNPPMPAMYSGEYNSDNIICNKLFPILNDYDASNDMLRDNLTYTCVTKNNEDLGIKYINGDEVIDFTNKDRNYINVPYYDMYKLDVKDISNKIYMIPAYDLSQNYPFNVTNWEDLTRYPLDYENTYKIKINNPTINFIKNNDIGNNINNEKIYLQSCRTNIDLDTCTNMCKNNNKCQSFEYIDKNNTCCLKSNVSKSNKNSDLYIKNISV